jgi:hypothetical protein
MTTLPERHRARWTKNEYKQLENEVENEHLSIDKIAEIHKRTYNAILYKLQDEGYLDRYFDLSDNSSESDLSCDTSSESDEDSDILYLQFEKDNKSVGTQIIAIFFILNIFITIYNLYLYNQ